MDKKIITISAEETEKLGEEFAGMLKPGDAVFLIGELGSGKTTFVKGVAKGLGITTRIISPTFVIMRTHEIKRQKSEGKSQKVGGKSLEIRILYHLDLYRLVSEKQTLDIGLKDVFEDPKGVTFIEWPDVSQNLIRKKVWKIKFETLSGDNRVMEIVYE